MSRTMRPMRTAAALLALCAQVLCAQVLCADLGFAQTPSEDLPTIVTYELRQARIAARDATNNPRRFWIKQIVAGVEDNVARQPFRLDRPATVLLRFSVDRRGRLLSPAVATSSGNAEADKAALRILAGAAPFPPMPDAIPERELAFTLPMRFH